MQSLKKEDRLLKFFLERELNLYNVWFGEVEKEFGLEKTINISLKIWNKLARIDGKKFSETFQIPGKNLDELLKLLDIAFHFTLFKVEIKKIDENSAYITFISCHWQNIIAKSSKFREKPINCNLIGISAYSSFINSINPDFEIINDKVIHNGDDICRLLVRRRKKI